MALPNVTVDAASYPSLGLYTWSHTIGNHNNRMLIVGVSTHDTSDIVNVTLDWVPLTRLGNSQGISRGVTIWYMMNPPIGAGTIIVFSAVANKKVCGAISLYNVDQTSPFRATAENGATGATYTLDISTNVNDLILAVGCGWHESTDYEMIPDVAMASRWNYVDSKPQGWGGTLSASANTTTISGNMANSSEWRLYLMSIQPHRDYFSNKVNGIRYSGKICGLAHTKIGKVNAV